MKIFTIALLLSMAIPALATVPDSTTAQKKQYLTAREQILSMLKGSEPLNFEKALFLTENAYNNNAYDWDAFQDILAFHEKNIRTLMKANPRDSIKKFRDLMYGTPEVQQQRRFQLLANWAIFKYLTDTTLFVLDSSLYLHMPYTYSYKDPYGSKNWKNTQVTHLLSQNGSSGNCFALASLYMIFSERLNSGASFAVAPGHIYITHPNDDGTSFNIELPTRSFPGNGSVMTLTYTPIEAIRTGFLLRKLDEKQSIALSLVYLGEGYKHLFGYKDNYTEVCADMALQADGLSLNAMLLKTQCLEEKLVNSGKKPSQLQADNEFKGYEKLICKMYDLGYREMPIEMRNLILSRVMKEETGQIMVDHTSKPLPSVNATDTRSASVSWGVFDEQFIPKPIEKYGRAVFDTKKKKIIAFSIIDSTFNKYPIDYAVAAWSVDPLAHKYPGISPYVAFADNPILFVDSDGRKIFIYYKDENGNNKSYEYGSKQEVPNNEFVQNSIKSLNYIKECDLGNQVISTIQNDNNKNVNVLETKNPKDVSFTASKPINNKTGEQWSTGNDIIDASINSGDILWAPFVGSLIPDGSTQSPSTGMFHELGHAFMALYFTKIYLQQKNISDVAWHKISEKTAVENYENVFASFNNEGTRIGYNGSYIYTIDPTSNREAISGSDIDFNGKGEPIDLDYKQNY